MSVPLSGSVAASVTLIAVSSAVVRDCAFAVGAAPTTWVMLVDELLYGSVPTNVAVMVCEPALMLLMAGLLAVLPPASSALPTVAPSTVKVTVPSTLDGENVAVKVTAWPTLEGFTELVSEIVVGIAGDAVMVKFAALVAVVVPAGL